MSGDNYKNRTIFEHGRTNLGDRYDWLFRSTYTKFSEKIGAPKLQTKGVAADQIQEGTAEICVQGLTKEALRCLPW